MAKVKARFRRPSPTEQHVLEHLTVRLVTDRAEQDRFDQVIKEHHYLHSATLVGEHLRYVVSYHGEWLALAGWSAAALARRGSALLQNSRGRLMRKRIHTSISRSILGRSPAD